MAHSMDALAGYEVLGDPDEPYEPRAEQIRAQRVVEKETAKQAERQVHVHYHTVAKIGTVPTSYIDHSHGEAEEGHEHPPEHRFPRAVRGGHDEEFGPAMAERPPLRPEAAAPLRALLSEPTPPHSLMRWRLRLYCGHVTEMTAHRDHRTVPSLYGRPCPECGLQPVTVVAARALGLAGDLPTPAKISLARRPNVAQRLAASEAEVHRLRAELAHAKQAGDATGPT